MFLFGFKMEIVYLSYFFYLIIIIITLWGPKMNDELLNKLKIITEEEKQYLEGKSSVSQKLYTNEKDFIVDSKKLLEKGQFIQFRPHTRFVHFPSHKHNYLEMIYMCNGQTTHIINADKRLVLREGDILFLNQNVSHEILPAGKDDIAVNFIILPEFFSKSIAMLENDNVLRDFLLSSVSGKSENLSYLLFESKGILPVNNLIENMIWMIINKTPNINTTIQTTMGLLFMNLSKYSETLKKDDPAQFDQGLIFSVLQYIDNNYRDGSLEDIASSLGLPTYQLSRLLKKYTGKNFKDLLKLRKLQQASYLLKDTSLTIDEIMEKIGYNNSSYFYNSFKELYGTSPKKYRAKA